MLFQFHIGSIQVYDLHNRHRADASVSIPHWFDSSIFNRARSVLAGDGFNSTLVRFKFKPGEGVEDLDVEVSIPHWFDSSDQAPRRSRRGVLVFQFHIGSIQVSDNTRIAESL